MSTERRLADEIVAVFAGLGIPIDPLQVQLVRPARLEHGDWSTNAALVVAKSAGRPPRDIANGLAAALQADSIEDVVAVEVAGPGFVNFRLADSWLHHALTEVIEAGTGNYATSDLGGGER